MDNIIFISTILSIHILAWLTPGPLFVLIIRNSLIYSQKIGIFTAIGFLIGNIIHVTLAVFGISLIISTSSIASNIIKFLGAFYLIYLGIKTFVMEITIKKSLDDKNENISSLKAIRIGFLTNILSPGAYLFFASIFATVLSSDVPSWVIIFLAIAMPINTFIMASIFSLFFTHKRIKAIYSSSQYAINKCLGATLILLALFTVFK